jgi:hypothetical protein
MFRQQCVQSDSRGVISRDCPERQLPSLVMKLSASRSFIVCMPHGHVVIIGPFPSHKPRIHQQRNFS